MARVPGKKTKIYVDKWNWSGRTNTAEMNVNQVMVPVTTFESLGDEFIEGKYSGDTTINGFFDPTANDYDEQMWLAIGDGQNHAVGEYYEAAAVGTIGYEIQALIDSQERPIEVAGAVLLNCTGKSSGAIVRSTVLANKLITGAGVVAGSSINVGATTAGQVFVALMRVLSFTGATMNVRIEQSFDNGGADPYTALLTFAQTAGTEVQRLTTTAATEAWKRVNVTAVGAGFTSALILVVVGVEQGT